MGMAAPSAVLQGGQAGLQESTPWLPRLCQRLPVLVPPPGLTEDFFWPGHHWVRPSVMYLPVVAGGQGLMDIAASTAAFRLQAVQRLLYDCPVCWKEVHDYCSRRLVASDSTDSCF